MLTFKSQNNRINLEKTHKVLEKSFTLAAQRVGSMRGVFQGDVTATLKVAKLKDVA